MGILLGLVLVLCLASSAAAVEFPGADLVVPSGYPVTKYKFGTSAWRTSGTGLQSADAGDLVLTEAGAGQKGQAWISQPVAESSWEVRFWVSATGDVGKGMAFWYTQAAEPAGILYGSNEKFNGLVCCTQVLTSTFTECVRRDFFLTAGMMTNQQTTLSRWHG